MTQKNIARYEVQSEIGRGGMATVYLAYDPNFRRKVAIKLVSVNLQENPVFRARFEREAHLIARIEHPAIVPVYDFGEQDQQPYLVMRYMAGGSLSGRIAGKMMPLEEAARILAQIAPALDAVHAQGIVHRDLKPGNILFDDFGNAAIGDFGIAHLSEATVDLTGSALIGTPAYMSPEQVQGERELDGRSDVYALGVILFEMLTGQGPFRATTPMSVALKHLTEPIPSILSLRPELPSGVELVLNKALAKDREMRYASPSAMAQDFQTVLATEIRNPIPTPPVSADAHPMTKPPTPTRQVPAAVPPARLAPAKAAPKPPARQASLASSLIKTVSVLGVIVIFLAMCGLGILFLAWIGLDGTPAAPVTVDQPVATDSPATAVPAPTATPDVIFSDNFLDDQSLWPISQDSAGIYAYKADGYSIAVTKFETVLWATTTETFDDASYYVDARPALPDREGYYGLLCRTNTLQDYYYFIIHTDGSYVIGKYKEQGFKNLLGNDWIANDAIRPGSETNRLRADCSGETLRFYANDVLLAETSDPDFTTGSGGLIVASLDNQGFEVVFNNYLVTRPAP